MGSANSNVIELRQYLKSHPQYKEVEMQEQLDAQRVRLRKLDDHVIDMLPKKHNLREIIKLKNDSVALEEGFIILSNWLEDKIAEENNDKTKAVMQAQFKQVEQLFSKNERIKKNIADDMTQRRFEALDPIKVGGSIFGTPTVFAGLTKIFFTDKPEVIMASAGVGIVVGVGLAFHRQGWDLCKRATNAIIQSPSLKTLRTKTHRSVITTTLSVSMIVGGTKEIRSSYPERASIRPKMMIAARL